jgi:heparanase 1
MGLGAAACRPGAREASPVTLVPARMAAIGTVDEPYQSYNVEMLEVTGGNFWKPYGPELDSILKVKQPAAPAQPGGDTPAGMNPAIYAYRPPIDLTNARLRTLAAALGPAYVRVSGTWANTSYFPASGQTPKTPPAGFNGVLPRQQSPPWVVRRPATTRPTTDGTSSSSMPSPGRRCPTC